MSLMGARQDELHVQRIAEGRIRRRVERRYAALKSFSPAMRKHFAERDIRAAMIAAGLPLPVQLSFEEKVERWVGMVRRDRAWLTRKTIEPKVRAAVLARLASEVA